jgi:hypothetical protein
MSIKLIIADHIAEQLNEAAVLTSRAESGFDCMGDASVHWSSKVSVGTSSKVVVLVYTLIITDVKALYYVDCTLLGSYLLGDPGFPGNFLDRVLKRT